MDFRTRVFVDGALISSEGKLLLLRRRADSCWELPCGVLEFGEEPEYAVARVFSELTGIEVTPDRPVGSWGVMSGGEHSAQTHDVHIGYMMTLSGALLGVELDPEIHSAFAWILPRELPEKIDVPAPRRACERAFAALARTRNNK